MMVGFCLTVFTACQTNRPQLVIKEDVIIGIGSINGTRVAARGKPTVFSQLVFQFNRGEKVKILGEITLTRPKVDEPHKWLRVQVPADCGLWVHSDDLGFATAVDDVDAQGQIMGQTMDFTNKLGSNMTWSFRAACPWTNAATAKVTKVVAK